MARTCANYCVSLCAIHIFSRTICGAMSLGFCNAGHIPSPVRMKLGKWLTIVAEQETAVCSPDARWRLAASTRSQYPAESSPTLSSQSAPSQSPCCRSKTPPNRKGERRGRGEEGGGRRKGEEKRLYVSVALRHWLNLTKLRDCTLGFY